MSNYIYLFSVGNVAVHRIVHGDNFIVFLGLLNIIVVFLNTPRAVALVLLTWGVEVHHVLWD